MIKKIRDFLDNMLGRKLFNKLFLMYSVIIVVTFLILLFIVSDQVTRMITEQDISFNQQVIQTVDDFFSRKCRQQKNTLIDLYQDAYARPGVGQTAKDVLTVLRGYQDTTVLGNIQYQQSIYKFLNDSLNLDYDLSSVSIIGSRNSRAYTSWRRSLNPGNTLARILPMDTATQGKVKPRIFFTPAVQVDESTRMFFLVDMVRDETALGNTLGYLAFGYGPGVVKNAYSHYQPLLKGTILILTPEGGVMFDSGDEYYGQAFPYTKEVKAKGNGTVTLDDFIINVNLDEEFGFYTLGILPKKDIDDDVASAKRLIFLLMFIAIATITVLSYVSTVLFSKRVKLLIGSIKRIRKGDLTVRTAIPGSDELSEISDNLNIMCAKLDEHIKTEYLYKLRQREAELYTLQAQVNPHFLYNSLEAIRMAALKEGNANVGRMVLLLADLYRGSVKEKIVISVRDELNNCKSFLEFYNCRFESRLDLVYRISDEILGFGILKHLIQPIVENVLVHGVNLAQEENIVTIEGFLQDGAITIVVRDNGHGIEPDKLDEINESLGDRHRDYTGSIGIYNVNQRIKLIYGEEYGVTIRSEPNEGTEVTVRIQAKTIEELTADVQGTAG